MNWIARDKNGSLYWFDRKPDRVKGICGVVFSPTGRLYGDVDDELFPEILPGECRRVTVTVHEVEPE